MARPKRQPVELLPDGIYRARCLAFVDAERKERPWTESELAERRREWEEQPGPKRGRKVWIGDSFRWEPPRPATRYESGKKFRWTFRIYTEDGRTVDVIQTTPAKLRKNRPVSPELESYAQRKPGQFHGEESQAIHWVEAVLNRTLSGDWSFNDEDLVGCSCKVTLITRRGRNRIKNVTARDWE